MGLLSIETGYSCNSRCGFCHQVAYRQTPGATIDLTTDQIKAKIAWGARNGYDEVGFSGGEVTIRPDAIELVAYARAQGFHRIGLTTNGRMLAYPSFAMKLVAAGVTSLNFSIHGHTAALHDMLVYSPGSFDQAMTGIDNLHVAAAKLKRRVDLMSMSLATPMNVDHFPDIVRLMGAKGVRLHMLQPFIVNEDSVEASDRFMVGYDRIEAALRAGIEVARSHDGKVKLYNIPPCLLRDVSEGIDHQTYSFDVFSKHDQKAADEANTVPWGFYRIPECKGCKDAWICPGFRREYYPESRLLDECAATLKSAPGDDGEVWLGGTEMLSDVGLRRLIGQTRQAGAKRIALTTGGSHRLAKVLYSLAEEEGVDEIVFVAHWQDPKAQDPRILERGNAARLKTGLERAQAIARSGPLKVGLTFGLQDLLAPEAMREFRTLRAGGIARFYVGISYAPHHLEKSGETRPDELARSLELLRILMSEGGEFTFIDREAPPGAIAPAGMRATLTELLPRRDGMRLLAPTPMVGVEYYFITWSIPHWAVVPVTPDSPPPAVQVVQLRSPSAGAVA